MKKILLASLSVLATFGSAGFAFAGLGSATPRDDATDAIVKAQRPAYPFRACVVSGKRFSDEVQPIAHVAMGSLLYLCSAECAKTVDANPEAYVAKLNEAVIAHQKPIYPLTTCVVSGEELGGSMGEPIDVVHGTRLVRLCCKGCRKELAKDADAFIAKVDLKLIETLRADYPLDKCPISGKKLADSDKVVDKLYGVTLVRLCCNDCTATYEKDPRALAMRVQDAQRESHRDDKTHKDGKGEREGKERKKE